MISLVDKLSRQQWFSKASLYSHWFAIYGLGVTGKSVINHFKQIGFDNYTIWDDNKKLKKLYNLDKKNFSESLNFVDYIVISPGINIERATLRKQLKKNKNKIITDLDLFYIMNPEVKTIVITGTNGKSTTSKIIEHVLKKNTIDVKLGGNIGTAVLNLKLNKQSIVVIEASSFQLEYSKFIKPTYAIFLNISKDHLDWHKNMKNYINSKLKIFSLQNSKNFAFLSNKKIIKKFKGMQYLSKLKTIDLTSYKSIETKIKNKYLKSKVNEENVSFVYELSKVLKIKNSSFIKALNSFNGLPHRHEIFYNKNNIKLINDSKATTFEASKYALQSNENIFWIVGGLPKLGDKFYLKDVKKNIIKSFIIGKHINFFKSKIKKDVKFKVSKTLNNALQDIFKELKIIRSKKITILLSPASASFDQYKNFNEKGNEFKKLAQLHAKKYFKR